MARRISAAVRIVVLLAVTPLFSAGREPLPAGLFFTDSGLVSCGSQSLSCGDIRKIISRQENTSVSTLLRRHLDSLGFFSAVWDSGGDTTCVTPGARAVIAAESIFVEGTRLIDSLPTFSLPRLYDAADIRERQAAIGRRCAEIGHPFARVAVSILGHPEGEKNPSDSLRLLFRVDPDRICLFASPLVSGAKHTRRGLLLNDVTMRAGQRFDSRKIYETIERLSRRSYVADASVGQLSVVPGDGSSAAGERDLVQVPLLVADRSGLGLEGALGYSSASGSGGSLQGNLTLTLHNVFKEGEDASLLYAGDDTYQQFNLAVEKPWFLGRAVTVGGSFGIEIHESLYGYVPLELTAVAEIGRLWRTGLTLKGSETVMDSLNRSWRYVGADLLLERIPERRGDNILSRELSLITGSGIALRERTRSRNNVDFTAGVHAPLWNHHALLCRISAKHLITDEDTLSDAEKYRLGGFGEASSRVRGYLVNEFSFRTVALTQWEYHYYFDPVGSLYLFADGGFGFSRSLSLARWSGRQEFLGYGIGITVPAALGKVTLEWARTIDDMGGAGRIQVTVQNALAGETRSGGRR